MSWERNVDTGISCFSLLIAQAPCNENKLRINLTTQKTTRPQTLTKGAIEDSGLTDKLREILKANAPRASIPNTPKVVIIHLDGNLPKKLAGARLSNFLVQSGNRFSKSTLVAFQGSEEQVKFALEQARNLGLKRSQYVAESRIPKDYEDVPHIHLAAQDHLFALKSKYPKEARWVVTQEEKDFNQFSVCAFGPIATLLELVSLEDQRMAYDFFRQITPYKDMTFEEFKLLVEGDSIMSKKYPLIPIQKVDFELAVKLYLLSRTVDFNA